MVANVWSSSNASSTIRVRRVPGPGRFRRRWPNGAAARLACGEEEPTRPTCAGGRHHHVKVRDNDPDTRVAADGVFTEFFDPTSSSPASASPVIRDRPDVPLELRVEFTRWAATARSCASCRVPTTPASPASTARAGRRNSPAFRTYLDQRRIGRSRSGATATARQRHSRRRRTHTTIVRQKPMMDMRQILLMNFGFFGIQYSFGMQQTAINPIFQFIRGRPACRS